MYKCLRNLLLLTAAVCLLLTGCGQKGQNTQTSETDDPAVEQNESAQQPSGGEEDAEAQPEEKEETEETYTDNFSVDQEAVEAFAQKIQAAAADKDLEGLADLMMFPNYVGFPDDPQFVDTREDFLALGAERVFTEELLTELSTADLSALNPSEAGFILSASGCPNVIFGVAEGHLAIVGINY